jgi:DNA-binding ferritin-like protein
MDKCTKVAALYVVTLKAIAQIHQHNHWVYKGYGNHLLFERLYESTLENLDLAAEKFIGIFGDSIMNYDLQVDLLNKVLVKYSRLEGSPVGMSLAIEKDFIKFSKSAYECFESEDKLTLGLDDMIMAIVSQREESVYLLQRNL